MRAATDGSRRVSRSITARGLGQAESRRPKGRATNKEEERALSNENLMPTSLYATLALLLCLGGVTQSVTAAQEMEGPTVPQELALSPFRSAETSAQVRVDRTGDRGKFLPELPGLRLFDGADYELSERVVAKLLYASMEEKLRRSGYAAELEVSEIRTLYAEDFHGVLWPDLVTLSGGDELRIDRIEVTFADGTLGLSYRPQWVVDESEQTRAVAQMVEGMSLGTMLELTSADVPAFARVVAVTAYRVDAAVADKRRVYNAAVFWSAEDDGRVTFTVQDQVVERVDEALVESLKFAPQEVLMSQALLRDADTDSVPGRATAATTTGSCRDFTQPHTFDQTAGRDFQGHVSGYHEGKARFIFHCSCSSSDCRSTCQPSMDFNQSVTYCSETGNLKGTGAVHKPRTSQKFQPGSIPSTDFTGANCGAGYACAIQWCPLSGCGGFQITGSAAPLNMGVEITFSYSAQPVWDGQVDFPFQCDGCAWGESGDSTPPVEENRDTGDWTGGGSGGGGGTTCTWVCEPIYGGPYTYYEECSLHCIG